MAAPYNALCAKLEEAMESVVNDIGLDASVSVRTGFDTETIQAPFVVLNATGEASELVWGSGIYTMGAEVVVSSSLDDQDDRTDHKTLVGQVFDEFTDDGIASSLSSAVEDFHCYQVRWSSHPQEVDNRRITNRLALDCVICGVEVG